MSKTVAFIHTSSTMIPLFKGLSTELLPRVATFNMVDESLLCDIIREKGCPPLTARRLVRHVLSAEEAGADFILVTCSSMGKAVDAVRSLSGATVLRVDDPMVEKAVGIGKRIGVIATLPSTLDPTVALIRSRSASALVTPLVVEGAFEAVMSGNGAKHDELVGKALQELAQKSDVIILAQASMARVVDTLKPEEKPVPILSSPRLAVENLARLLA